MLSTDQPSERNRRQGFTLPELLIASSLFILVITQALSTLLASHRLIEATAADIELSLRTYSLREKLLFSLNEDEGGLMNASLSDLTVLDKKPNGKGKGLRFKPKHGAQNRLVVDSKKKIKADRCNEGWLVNGPLEFDTEDVFEAISNQNGKVVLNLDLKLPVANRTYKQKNQAVVQIMND